MYAIIKTGGKQYRVAENDVIDVELLNADQGSAVEFSEVLFVNDGKEALIGKPFVAGYLVKGEVVGTASGPKVSSLKYRPRGHTQKHWGHRQHFTRVKITDIGVSGKGAAKTANVEKPVENAVETEKKAAAKPKKAAVKSAAKTAKKATAAPKRQKKNEEDK